MTATQLALVCVVAAALLLPATALDNGVGMYLVVSHAKSYLIYMLLNCIYSPLALLITARKPIMGWVWMASAI